MSTVPWPPAPPPQVISETDATTLDRAVAALRSGEVIGLPTDTVYGLAAAIDQPQALARLYTLKGRPQDKAIPILLGQPQDIERVASQVPPAAARLAEAFWPGALTFVVPARDELPDEVTSTDGDGVRTVAVRVPDQWFAREIITAAGGSLAVTSANRSGEPPCVTAAEVALLGETAPDLVIDGGPAPRAMPSTIVTFVGHRALVLRAGGIAEDRIHNALASLSVSAANDDTTV